MPCDRCFIRFFTPRLLGCLSVAIFIGAVWPSSAVADLRARANSSGPFFSDSETGHAAHVERLPLKIKIGQMLMIGYVGQDLDRGLSRSIAELKPGAVIVFKRNIRTARQIATLNQEAQHASLAASGLPLLIAVDQEGGDVARIKTDSPLPSALALGRTRDTQLLHNAGKATGQLLHTLGFNMDLAPVLDLGNPSKNLFIGTRAYGIEPGNVAEFGGAFARGLKAAQVLPTAKHFPGHGSVSEDSHLQTPLVSKAAEQLRATDIIPFAKFADDHDQPVAVMLAHVAFTSLDATATPATFSHPIVTGLLRNQLKFTGLVLTDDIEMAGASIVADIGERAVRAVLAGADMVMVGWNKKSQARVIDSLVRAVQAGRIDEKRIDASVRRIFAAKAFVVNKLPAAPSNSRLAEVLSSPSFAKIARETLRTRFARPLDKGEMRFVDLLREKPAIVFSASRLFYQRLQNTAGPAARTMRFVALGEGQKFDISKVMGANPSSVGVVYVSGPRVAQVAAQINSDVAARMLLVTTEPPGDIANARDFAAMLDVYYRHPSIGSLTGQRYFNLAARGPSGETLSDDLGAKRQGANNR